MSELFSRFSDDIKNLQSSVAIKGPLPDALLMEEKGEFSVYYAPFDHVNPKAKVVLVGVTPGIQQAANAINAAQSALIKGYSDDEALKIAKSFASFSGPMRSSLVEMLDYIGLSEKLGITSCASLFAENSNLVHYTSALRYPVLRNNMNYSGTPSMLRSELLKKYLVKQFESDVSVLKEAIFIPLGPKVAEAMLWLASNGYLDESRILDGLPHPSGANAERIAYFLERKSKQDLSSKTNPDKIDLAKQGVFDKMNDMPLSINNIEV